MTRADLCPCPTRLPCRRRHARRTQGQGQGRGRGRGRPTRSSRFDLSSHQEAAGRRALGLALHRMQARARAHAAMRLGLHCRCGLAAWVRPQRRRHRRRRRLRPNQSAATAGPPCPSLCLYRRPCPTGQQGPNRLRLRCRLHRSWARCLRCRAGPAQRLDQIEDPVQGPDRLRLHHLARPAHQSLPDDRARARALGQGHVQAQATVQVRVRDLVRSPMRCACDL